MPPHRVPRPFTTAPEHRGALVSAPALTGPVADDGAEGLEPSDAETDAASGEVGALVADVARRLHLSEEQAARLVRLSRRSERALAPGTVRALRTDVARWVAWCTAARRLPVPARPQDVADFLEARAATWSPATLRRVLAAIARVHRVVGVADPTKDEEVALALRAALRVCADRGVGRPRQAQGLRADAAEACLAPLGTRLIDRRDTALVLVARDLLARRSELAALRVVDLTPAAHGGGVVLIARSKRDQAGQGVVRYVGPDAYEAVRRWVEAAGITDGPLFRSVHVTGRVGRALHPQKITEIFRKLAAGAAPALRRLGVEPSRISGHSARVGMAQDLLAAGFELGAIMQAGRWASPAMVARYTEALAAEDGAVAQFHAAGRPRGTRRR